jgi:hypothetical protein
MKAPGSKLVQIVDIRMENEISTVKSSSIAVVVSLFRHCDLDRSRTPRLATRKLQSSTIIRPGKNTKTPNRRFYPEQVGDNVREEQKGMYSVIIIHD